ncbi:hypothetical protein F4821DRAFT_277731 [Hypoxylon rubiginosum]|uniref:Uncharacterized protein n=1 Tax=Hypoxylon rubiginosum TaxID=110542 RepID=A0ACC0D485_9PEZI|nr:hypothetical protein F4821DRAFT_277731 [Hypoxylon rubiginosum]
MESFGYSQRRGAPAGGQMRKLVFFIAAASTLASTFASPQPIADNLAVTNGASLEARSGWSFSCYSGGESCFTGTIGKDGTTKGKGSGVIGCTEINKRGCSKFSFESGEDYKLCLYASDDCTGDGKGTDGSRVCGYAGDSSPGSYQVVSYDADCI